MSRNYKIHDQEDLHYLTYATAGWGMRSQITKTWSTMKRTNEKDHGSQIRGSGGRIHLNHVLLNQQKLEWMEDLKRLTNYVNELVKQMKRAQDEGMTRRAEVVP